MNDIIEDFLAKQLSIEKNVVTFRSLSRQFSLHVNQAKNILATFHNAQKKSEPVHAMYMLTGEAAYEQRRQLDGDGDIAMDVTAESSLGSEASTASSSVVLHTKVTLVSEAGLESARLQYTRIYSQHIYSLAPAPLVDAELIPAVTEKVYEVDAKLSAQSAVSLGRITGPHVSIGKYDPSVASSSKSTERTTRKELAPTKSKDQSTDEKAKGKDKDKTPTGVKPKTLGTLDWSKAKPKKKEEKTEKEEAPLPKKGAKEDSEKASKGKAQPKVKIEEEQPATVSKKPTKTLRPSESEPAVATSADSPRDSPSPDVKKRGIKRKSVVAIASDSESDVPAPRHTSTKSRIKAASVIKGAILSDSEEEAVGLKGISTAKGKGKASIEPSIRAMMEESDDDVVKASQAATEPETSDAPEESAPDEDVEMLDDMDELISIKPKPRKKKEKKEIPLGRNGFKKRRTVKSRTAIDDKGYMVTEDYSSYESVDEEESAEETKAKKTAPAKAKKVSASESSDAKAKGSVIKGAAPRKLGGKRAQGGLMDFFTKKTS